MTVTVFTSNQPRHVALVERLGTVAERVNVVMECGTVFPGQVDDFFRKSEVMQRYFHRVLSAEREVFGPPRFLPGAARALAVKMGDLNRLEPSVLDAALGSSDAVIVFGASYIRPPLVDRLIECGAVNIHMGCSPWYRGSSTNFWSMYDRRPEYVGATIHRLSRGLDSGDMLFHALPAPRPVDPFVYGMLAVKSAHEGLVRHLADGSLLNLPPVPQDRSRELRYTRNADFTDAVAEEYLSRLPTPADLAADLARADRSGFLRPFVIGSSA